MGMSSRIGRRVIITECDCLIVDNQNNTREEVIQLYGDYGDNVRAQNAVRRKLDNNRVLVRSQKRSSYYASMPIKKFLENADQITGPTPYTEVEGQETLPETDDK